MYFTSYVKQDGYWESVCSLKEGLGPILKCRAVIRSDGNHDSIVRDYTTGKMVASKIKVMSRKITQATACGLAITFIRAETLEFNYPKR